MKKYLFLLLLFVSFTFANAKDDIYIHVINGVEISVKESEIPKGNHPLIYLYVGTLGVKPFKLYINKIIDNRCYGYTFTGNNKVSFSGTFSQTDTTFPEYEIEVKGTQYKLELYEAKSNPKNGKFDIIINNKDAAGTDGNGTWISYDKTLHRKITLVGAVEP